MSRFSEILQRFAAGHPGVELVYASHPRWPLPSTKAHPGSVDPDIPHSLAVSVLDSSFNPPTMTHLALSHVSPTAFGQSTSGKLSTSLRSDFDAKLLLFSIKNADKSLKPGDATHLQRLEMMVLLASELEQKHGAQSAQNVAVAVCQEPTFVGKSTVLSHFLRERLAALSSKPDTATQLFFLLGFDTLERLFAHRYYASESAMNDALRKFLSPSGENSRVICARRNAGASYAPADTGVLDAAGEFIESGAVVLVDIGESERSLSSSEVREDVKNSTEGWERKVPVSIADYIKKNGLYGMSIDA